MSIDTWMMRVDDCDNSFGKHSPCHFLCQNSSSINVSRSKKQKKKTLFDWSSQFMYTFSQNKNTFTSFRASTATIFFFASLPVDAASNFIQPSLNFNSIRWETALSISIGWRYSNQKSDFCLIFAIYSDFWPKNKRKIVLHKFEVHASISFRYHSYI